MFMKRVLASVVTISALTLISVVGSNFLSMGPKSVAAQDVSVIVEGPLQSINNNTWVVNNVTIEIGTTTTVSGTPLIGSTVRVVALQRSDGKLTAQIVTITVTTSITSTAAATSQATAAPTSAATPAATPAATGVPIQYVKVVIEGPVEQVDLNIDIIVVYKQRIKVRHDDPIRTKIKVGDWVHVNGNLQRESGNTLIIIVINIIIINLPPVIIIVQPGNNNPPPQPPGKGMGMGNDDD